MTDVYSADWVLPVDGAPIEGGGVRVRGGMIVNVGPAEALEGDRHHFQGSVIVPGLVNAHTHLEYAVYVGFGDGLSFDSWLRVHMERKRRIDESDMLAIARLGAAQCLASGVTTVGDATWSGASARACDELGLRAIVYVEVFRDDADRALDRFDAVRGEIAAALSERVRLGASPHSPYTTSASVYRALTALGLPLVTHVAESELEVEFMRHGGGPLAELRALGEPPTGTSSIRHLADHGLLGPRLVAVHCVHVDADEVHMLVDSGASVAHCPRSNAYLGCGIAPLRELLDAGTRVGLGTDSPASTPSFDMFEEMRAAVLLARARGRRADALTATETLALATLGSARALGLGDEIGSLTPGKRADLTVVDLESSSYVPWEDPAGAIVFGGSPGRVSRTIVGGAVRYQRGGFAWDELREGASDARARMLTSELVAGP